VPIEKGCAGPHGNGKPLLIAVYTGISPRRMVADKWSDELATAAAGLDRRSGFPHRLQNFLPPGYATAEFVIALKAGWSNFTIRVITNQGPLPFKLLIPQ
jgi:hypothetical protein